MSSRIIFLYIALSLSVQISYAQYYDSGQDPASLKWMQIKTGRFTVIYPESYNSQALNFTHSLEEAYSRLTALYPERKFKVPVIIHNYSTKSNGLVTWAPKRMEIYPTPDQNSLPLDPVKQLAIHELTHVFQMESLNNGFTKAMSVIFGEQMIGAVSSLVPMWFFEGNAVLAESALTESGRGRTPSFQKQLKAIVLEKDKNYKYDKILHGSYRDYVPDHYQSGFQMVTWAMSRYDPMIWNNVLKFTANQPFTINPVNISLTRNAGLRKKTLYEEAFDTLKTIWKNEDSHINAKPYAALNPDKKRKYISYNSPVFAGTDSIIAVKSSLSEPPEFVLLSPSGKKEKKLHVPGQMSPLNISYAEGRLVWVETQNDKRWENRDYSVIKLMDLRTGIVKRLSRKTRYLSASLSPNGREIAATVNSVNNENRMVILDSESGNVINTLSSPENAYLQKPQWSEGGESISVIYLTEAGEGIMSYNIANNQWQTLIKAGREDLQSSYLRNDSLFYISSIGGTDNIFLLTPDKETHGVTRSRFGVTDLSISGRNVLFSDYASQGNNICCTTLSEVTNQPINKGDSASFLINRLEIKPSPGEYNSSSVYSPEKYRKWQHLFRFHSWMPFYADIEEIKSDPASIRPGVTILTQNYLSSLISSIGYEYSAEKKNVLHTRLTWKGWYPVFESELDYGNDPRISKVGESVNNPSEIQPGLRFSNNVSIPLSFSSGRFSQYLRPYLMSEYRNDYIYVREENSYDQGQMILSGRIYFSNYYKYAYRDIYPKWAQTIDLNYSFAPFDKDLYGTSNVLKTSFYFPGIFRDNGIKVRFETEKQYPSKFMYGNRVSLPRGYENIISKEIIFYSVDYVFPLTYPDFNIASFLYLKRIRSGLFYDYSFGTGNTYYNPSDPSLTYYHNFQEKFKSFGFELLADFHLLRIPFMISGGVQTAWKDFNAPPSFKLLFNIDIYGMTLGKRPD